MKRYVLILCLLIPFFVEAQIGGTSTYQFLSLTNSARVSSLGGYTTSIKDGDLNLVYCNPALLDESMDNNIVLNYVNYFAGVNYGYASYAKNAGNLGNFAAGVHYINYGEFVEADETGQILGSFNAADYSINLYWSKSFDSLWSVGAAFKTILSEYERYTSYGNAIDFGITYNNPELFTASVTMRNLGYQFTGYSEGTHEPLPLDIQFGISKKLKHAPLRIIAEVHNLQKPVLSYTNPETDNLTTDPITGEEVKEKSFPNIMDNVGRHMIVGAEITPFDNFYLRLGYNYQRRAEMLISTRKYLVGFSMGVGFRIYKFHLSYGRAQYHLAGATNHFSISANLSEFYK
ncbi:MAG: hypothetical protein C0594_14920 [Marinilabiliales bacterium]|nr:MAG: hypothetical protein C0594_14920 [Marinilabiliales bacterium]